MPASALTGRPALSGRNWGAFAVRTIACVRSATSWQRRRPGSRGRAKRARTGLPVHERAPGPVSHSYHGPRPEGFGLGLRRDGMIESLRVLMACRKTAVSARRVALQMIHNVVVIT